MIRTRSFYMLLFTLLFGTALNSWSQGREYTYDHYNISNGLISDNVFKIFVDREGHAWIITYNGLQKYNGYEFMTYTSDANDPGSLSSNFVEDLFEDDDGELVVVYEDGIDIYNKGTDSFRNLIKDLPFASLRRNEISRQASAVQDKSGAIWVNCNNQLVRIDSSKSNFIIYEDEYRGRFVLNRDSTFLLIITDRAIKKYDLTNKLLTITGIGDVPSPVEIGRLNTIFYDSDRICWVGTSDGLFIFDEDQGCFVDPVSRYFKHDAALEPLLREEITAIFEDFKTDLWVASGSTLRRINRQTGRVETLRHETDNSNSILNEQITGIHGDQSGIIWLTYLNEGFTRINIRTQDFRSFRYRENLNMGLGGNAVRSIFRDPAGFIWVGLYNDGLDRIDTRSGNISHYKYDPTQTGGICSNYISSLFLDDHERLWIGSHDNGLCIADGAHDGSIRFSRPDFLNQHQEIYHILGDSLGRIWIGTRNGLGMFDYGSGQFQWILENHNVQSFLFDRYTIWISSWDHGLCRLDFTPEQFALRTPGFDTVTSIYYRGDDLVSGPRNNDQQEPLILRNCISIYQDKSSRIWIGTYAMGLARAEPGSEGIRYTYYKIKDGAPGNAIYGVLGDEQGNIWVSTENGLGKFDPVTERFENYYREDGLLSDYFMWKSYFKAPDGELYFGGVDGFNLFYPRDIKSDTSSFRVLVSEFRIQNKLVECGDTINGDVIMDRHISQMNHLVLNHRNNRNFSFSFYATGLVNHHRIKYSYMLEGYDNEWIRDVRGMRLATYNNLSPGTYHFRVMATENESAWDGTYVEKMLTILPPWWKTNYAYSIYLLLILALVIVITHSLVRFIGLKHELAFNEKLHQSKLMFFTNISHELKTPLSLIKAPLNDILDENRLSPRNRKNLLVARHNADNLLKLVNELLEFRRTDAGISKLRAEKIELTGIIRDMVEEFECVAEQRRVHFYFDIPEERIQIWVDREKFRKIINNLLENALKYTSDDGLVTLSLVRNPLDYKYKPHYNTLRLNKEKRDLQYIGILVSDTGVGISRESLPKIFDRFYQIEAERASHHIGSGIGLALVKNLVLIHHGEIGVGSERGVGTEILVMFPLGDGHLTGEEKMAPQACAPLEQSVLKDQPISRVMEPVKEKPTEKNKHLPRILVVEDHDELRNYLKERLSEDYLVMDAPNGALGLQTMRQFRPDLVILDWIMPVMDGEALIRRVREDATLSSTPVILLTGKSELHEREAGLNLGADLVITKPFSIQMLTSQIRRIIENNRIRMLKYSGSGLENIEEVNRVRETEFLKLLDRSIINNIRNVSLNAAILAADLGVSRTVLYERVRSVTGQTIGEYVQKLRIKHAIRLMLYEKRPLSEVHVMVGFSSSSYMIRLFRKYYQTTPGEYIRTFLTTSSN